MRARLLAITVGLGLLALASVAYGAVRIGTDAADTIFGTTQDDRIDAKGAFDIVFGLSGDDRIKGGNGDDNIQADAVCPAGSNDPGACDQTRGSGNDTVEGNAGDDVIAGGRGNDRISGGSGVDNIQGGSGRDTIHAGTGKDSVFAGSGNDSVSTRDGSRDSVDCGTGRDTARVDRRDKVAGNCERVIRS